MPPQSDDSKSMATRQVLLVALLGGALGLLRFQASEYVIDDAYITFRVARNWVEAGVPTFDLTQPPTESSTTTSWMLLSALWIRLAPGADPMPFARVLGALCHLGTLVLLLKLAGRLAAEGGGVPWLAALIAALLFDASGWLAYHAMAGMETALYGLCFIALAERLSLLWTSRTNAHAWQVGCLLGLLALTRPEGVLLALVVTAGLTLRRTPWPAWWRVALPAVVVIAALQAWRWHTYGELVPNTYFAKPPSLAEGVEYAGRYVLFGVGVFGPLAVAPVLRRVPSAPWLLALALIVLLATTLSGGDWMPAFRRLAPTTLVLMALAGAGLSVATGRVRAACVVGLVAWLGGDVAMWLRGTDAIAFNGEISAKFGRVSQESGFRTVAMGDLGSFSWAFRGSIFDPYGLTDRHVAHLPGGYADKQFDDVYFAERNPDLVILRSFEPKLRARDDAQLGVMRSDRGMAHFVANNDRYAFRARLDYAASPKMYALMYVRRDVVLPDRLWKQVPVPDGL